MKTLDLIITIVLTITAFLLGLLMAIQLTGNIHDVGSLLMVALAVGFIVPLLYWTVVKKIRMPNR
jgi:hypothetical protein